LAETLSGLYKAELIHRRTAWKTRESVELATLEWVAWFNHHRLMEPFGYIPPAEAGAVHNPPSTQEHGGRIFGLVDLPPRRKNADLPEQVRYFKRPSYLVCDDRQDACTQRLILDQPAEQASKRTTIIVVCIPLSLSTAWSANCV
jgi:hypothetical protein